MVSWLVMSGWLVAGAPVSPQSCVAAPEGCVPGAVAERGDPTRR
jgi:hypothetical protein